MNAQFIKMPINALLDTRLGHRDLRVLMALYSFGANPGDVVWPSREDVAKRSRCHPSHVSASMTKLESLGWIVRARSPYRVQVTLFCPDVSDLATSDAIDVADLDTSLGERDVAESVRRCIQIGNPDVADLDTCIKTDHKQTNKQTNSTVQDARDLVTEDKRPSGTSEGGDGSHNGEPTRSARKVATAITDDWTPSNGCWDLIDKHGISRAFAELEVGEFILFWKGEGTQRKSWDATFLNRVKTQWKREQERPGGGTNLTPLRPRAANQPSRAAGDFRTFGELRAQRNIDIALEFANERALND